MMLKAAQKGTLLNCQRNDRGGVYEYMTNAPAKLLSIFPATASVLLRPSLLHAQRKNLHHENTLRRRSGHAKLQKPEKPHEIIMLSYHQWVAHLPADSRKSVETATRATINPPIPLCKGGALSGFHLLANEAADKRPRALLPPLFRVFVICISCFYKI
jgi:hypothetical protein